MSFGISAVTKEVLEAIHQWIFIQPLNPSKQAANNYVTFSRPCKTSSRHEDITNAILQNVVKNDRNTSTCVILTLYVIIENENI